MKIILHILLFFVLNIYSSLYSQNPTVTVTSSDVAFCESGSATLTVDFTGDAPFNFMYKIDGSYLLGSAAQDIYSTSSSLDIADINTSTTIEVVRVYDNVHQYDSDNPMGSGVAVTGESMVVQIDEMPTPSAGVYDPICGYELTLNGTVTDADHTVYWNEQTGVGTYSDINSPTSTFTADQEGDVTFILTEINGECTATDEVAVTFQGSPTAKLISDGEYKFCSTDSDPDIVSFGVEFTGNEPFSYVIKNNTNSFNQGPSGLNDHVQYTVTSSDQYYIYSVTDDNGCEASAEDITGTQIVTDLKPTVYAGEDQLVCGSQYVLQAQLNSGNSGSWSSSEGDIFDLVSDKNAIATFSDFDLKQDVTFTWTETEPEMGCSDNDDVVITFVEYPELVIPNVNDEICEGNSTYMDYTLTGNGPWNLTYNDGLSTQPIDGIEIASSSIEFTPTFDQTMNLQSQTIYSFTRVEDAMGCVTDYNDEKQYTVLVDEKPIADIGELPDEVCGKILKDLNPQTTIVDGTWSGEGVFNTDEDGITSFTASDFGEATIIWDVVNGACNDVSDQRTITFKKVPYPVNAGEDKIIYGTLSFDLNAAAFADDVPDAEGEWTSLELADIKSPNEFITDVSVDDYGIYNFVWTTSIPGLECDDWDLDDTVQVKVKKLIIPTGFSPNTADGYYDYFKIYGLENLNHTKLTVFDKRGKLVYKCEDCNNIWGSEGWNGIGKDGSLLEQGTYYIVFEADELSEPQKQYLIIK